MKYGLTICFLAAMGSGCVFEHDKTAATPHAAANIAGVTAVADQATPLARSSGAVTYIRLAALFPNVDTTQPATSTFTSDNFSFLNASGIFSTLGSSQKPTSPLAQIALRDQASALCNTQVGGSSDRSSIFSTSNILMPGESLPTDAVQKLAFAAARNIWLDAYTVSMPEVQALIALYNTALQNISVSNGDLQARRAVCEAAILAPQFWMGSPLATDVIRRIALEIGRRKPTFAEIGAFKAGTLSVKSFVEQVQKEKGYLAAINDWHQDWLGLRNFYPDGDPRGDNISSDGSSVNGSSYFNGVNFTIFNTPAGANFSEKVYVPQEQPTLAQSCSPVDQAFDPRTTEIAWEQRDQYPALPAGIDDSEGWNVIGAQVHVDGVAAYKQRLHDVYFTKTSANDSYSVDRNASRDLMIQTYTDENGLFNKLCSLTSDPSWYNCNGVVLLPSSLRTTLQNEYSALTAMNPSNVQTDPSYPAYVEKNQLDTVLARNSSNTIIHMITPITGITTVGWNWVSLPFGAGPNYNNNSSGNANNWTYALVYGGQDRAQYPLGNIMNWPANGRTPIYSPIAVGNQKSRRMRRYSPSGEQNGYSIVKTWFKNTSVRVCNNIDRFVSSCFFRVQNANGQNFSYDYWGWNAASKLPIDHSGGHVVDFDSLAQYNLLSQFSCGVPSVADIQTQNESAAYPVGYTYNVDPSSHVGHYGGIGTLNTNATGVGLGDATGTTADLASEKLITHDIQQEPYHLLDYIVANNRNYRELLTANYTCGSQDFASFYQTQGYFLPVPASQIDQKIGTVGSSCSVPYGDTNLYRVEHQGIKLPIWLLAQPQPGWGLWQTPLSSGAWINPNSAITNSDDSNNPGKVTDAAPVFPLPNINGSSYSAYRSINGSGLTQIPERTMSGILTMPAFVAPVMPNARSLSARFFTRLLCADPTLFKPNAAQQAMHAQFISNRAHLQPQCISCHINLDPLASSFSSSFKYFEGHGLYEMYGEFGAAFQGARMSTILGVRAGGGNMGDGAFMGQSVHGIADLGNKVADSDPFAACVVQTAFTHIMGRSPTVDDSSFLITEAARFKGAINYNYNQLVEDIVVSNSYTEKQ